jgi:hypothetical protein
MGRFATAPLLLSLCAALLAPGGRALALETDQFTVPARPLADIGPEIDVYVAATVFDVVQDLGARADAHDGAARRSAWPWRDHHRDRAARYRSADFLTKRVFDAVAGPGLPESRIEQWVRRNDFRAARQAGAPSFFNTSLARCVYGDSPFNKPLLLAFLSPTVNIHGTYTGVDKLGHVFQHGYHYYEEYRRAEHDGCDDARATARAVKMGVAQERGFYGETMTGVFSNADLAANLVGLKFYLNLTRPVRIGDQTLAPLLLRDAAGNWCFNPHRRADGQLRLLVDDTFNEALNPSRFQGVLRDTVRDRLKRRTQKLLTFYDTTPQRERERVFELARWHGEDYGHSGFSRLVTIADNCPLPLPAVAGGDEGDALTAGARTSASVVPPPEAPSAGRTSAPRLSTR